jgi:hypothetical protein
VATGEKILELAMNAYSLYSQQDFVERQKLLDSILSNCTFDRGTLFVLVTLSRSTFCH